MTAEEQIANYRASCQCRRRGHIIEEWEGDRWVAVDLNDYRPLYPNWDRTQPKGVNRAKAYIRKHGLRSYNA